MKKTNMLYWIFTGLFAAFMIFSAVPDALSNEQAIQFVHDKLGYPVYIIPFIGVAKILGAIALLIPGFPRIKEWAYAGLMIDLVGAAYSLSMSGEGMHSALFMLLPIGVGAVSYYFYHQKLKGA